MLSIAQNLSHQEQIALLENTFGKLDGSDLQTLEHYFFETNEAHSLLGTIFEVALGSAIILYILYVAYTESKEYNHD